ncbi:MAG: drug/metabolite transporter (DMT)-like permease [Paracoccaceae bacterium]|jgi:drug/metabolite transporter (DMT)-like permease
MAGFTTKDLFLKKTTTHIPLGQALILFSALGIFCFGLWAKWRHEPLFPRQAFGLAMRWRAGFEILGRIFYSLAIAVIPLSLASAILQATPLVVVVGAALIFGEKVGWRRWSANYHWFYRSFDYFTPCHIRI